MKERPILFSAQMVRAIIAERKALPAGLPETIQPLWIDGAASGEMREAA